MEKTSKTFELNIVEVDGIVIGVNTKASISDLKKAFNYLNTKKHKAINS